MKTIRTFNIELESVTLMATDVRLDGDLIGTVRHLTTARRPKVWFCFDADDKLVSEGTVATGGFRTDTQAAFALVDHVTSERTAAAIIAKLSGLGEDAVAAK